MKFTCTLLLLLFCSLSMYSQTPEQKIKELGIDLLEPSIPTANYLKAVRTGNLIYLAGHGPTRNDGSRMTGKLGKDLTLDQGTEAARVATISLLSSLKAEIGELSKVKQIVKVNGMVNCTPDFYDQSKVMNGCSNLLVEIFGENGKHARAAVGMVALPFNIAVEIEMIVEVED